MVRPHAFSQGVDGDAQCTKCCAPFFEDEKSPVRAGGEGNLVIETIHYTDWAKKRRKPSKYKNVAAIGADGKRRASRAEARRDGGLALLERADKIHDLKRQPRYPLYVNGKLICTYVGDWSYRDGPAREHNAQLVCEDKKGVLTKEFKIKWALAKALHPEIEWRLS